MNHYRMYFFAYKRTSENIILDKRKGVSNRNEDRIRIETKKKECVGGCTGRVSYCGNEAGIAI